MLPTNYDTHIRNTLYNNDVEDFILRLKPNNEEQKHNMFNVPLVWSMPTLQGFSEIKRKRNKVLRMRQIKKDVKALKHRNKFYLSDYINFGFGRAL